MSTILLRRSSTASAVPTTGQLALGELAVNTYDGYIYFKQDNGVESVLRVAMASEVAASALLSKLLTVDGSGSLLDADLLDGQEGSFYQNADNLNAGTVPSARLTGSYDISVTGSAATLTTARDITLDGDVSGTASFDGSQNITITATVADDSHNHAWSNITSTPTTISGYGITDAYTKTEVDGLVTGLDFKESVRVATTGNVDLATGGLLTVDGVTLVAGNRVLVKSQTDATENGIYVAAAGAWSRSTDADNSPTGEVTAGMYMWVEEGTLYADSGWVLATDDPITLGTSELSFTQFNGLGQIVAGDGLTKSGSTINVVGTAGRIVANADSIDLATVTVGTSPTSGNVTFDVDSYGRIVAASTTVDGGSF